MKTLTDVQKEIQAAYLELASWRRVGERFGLNPATARLIAKGREPGHKVRKQLGLPIFSTVVVITGEPIPAGTQVITAALCACGQWYVSNSGNRTHCYICSPYKGKRK